MANANLDVFELTNTALKELAKESNKKTVKESVKSTSKTAKKVTESTKLEAKKLNKKDFKFESLRKLREEEGDDFEYTPDDEVVLVIDTDAEEVPETEEDAVAAAEDLVGETVCKCSICGANYICDGETIEEDVDGEVTLVAEEGVCPVCGEEGTQIVVGEIVADEEPVEDDETVEVEDKVEVEDEVGDDEFDFDEFEEEEEEEEEVEESVKRPMRRPMRRTNEARKPMHRPMKRATMESKSKMPAKRPMRKVAESNKVARRPMRKAMAEKASKNALNFNEKALSRMFTKFATENYSNVKTVKFTNGKASNGKLTLEGVVSTPSGKQRKITLVAEGWRNVKNNKMVLKATENGPFTESAIKEKNRATFVIECIVKGNSVMPTTMKYCFKTIPNGLKESKNTAYKVYGIVK